MPCWNQQPYGFFVAGRRVVSVDGGSALVRWTMDRNNRINRESYNAIASIWDGARMSFYGRELDYLGTFLDGLEALSCILDLGCGTGRPIAE